MESEKMERRSGNDLGDKVVGVRLPVEIFERLSKEADGLETTVSALVRMAVCNQIPPVQMANIVSDLQASISGLTAEVIGLKKTLEAETLRINNLERLQRYGNTNVKAAIVTTEALSKALLSDEKYRWVLSTVDSVMNKKEVD